MNPIHLTQLRCVRPSQFFNQLNKSVLKQTCERRASVFGDSTSEREFTFNSHSNYQQRHQHYTQVKSAIGLPVCCVYMHGSNLTTYGLSRQHNCAFDHSMFVTTGAKSPGQLDFDLKIFCNQVFVRTKIPHTCARKHVNSALFVPICCCTNWLWVK